MLRSNLFEEKKLPAPQTPPPSVQILDAIAFEALYEAGKIELFEPSTSTTAKYDLFLMSVDDLNDIEQNIYDEAKRKKTPILIREKGKFFIYGDKTGNGSWVFTEITQNLELRELRKLFFNIGMISPLHRDGPRFTLALINTLKKGHTFTAKPIKKVISLKEKIYILTSSFIPAVGFGLGNTIAVLLKFVAPVAGVGGAGLYISTGAMIALTGGFGLIALGLMYMMYHNAMRDAIKKIDTFNHQVERLQEEIDLKAAKILNDFNKAFAMLLKMKLALEQLKRAREASAPYSFPSHTEQNIEKRINSYINFLAQHPNHPNFQKIHDEKSRDKAIRDASLHRTNLKNYLYIACDEILNDDSISVKDYPERAEDYANELKDNKVFRDSCFPTLHFVAPKAKRPPFLNINLREFFTAFGSAFAPIFGLPFLTITLIGVFTTIPMAFPPLYPILALGLVYGLYNVYRVNDTKKLDAERNVEKLHMQKHLAYFHDSHNKLLKDRLHTELEEYTKYQYDVIATQFSPKPQPSPEFKKLATAGPTLSQKPAVDYIPSSDQYLGISIAGEDLRYNDPSQLTGLTTNTLTPPQSPRPASSSEEVKKTIPSITTPGFSVFTSSSSRNLESSSSSQNLPGLEGEDLRYNDPSQLTNLSSKPAVA